MTLGHTTGGSHHDALEDLSVDHVRLAVSDIHDRSAELADRYGFTVLAPAGTDDPADGHETVALGQGAVVVLLTRGTTDGHPASAFVQSHGEGVMDVALRTPDVAGAFATAVANGGEPAIGPTGRANPETPSIVAFGDVTHTFVPPSSPRARLNPPGPKTGSAMPPAPAGLCRVDHLAVCVPAGELSHVVDFYQRVLSLRTIFTERIIVGNQAMNSAVVQSASAGLTLTLIEPDPTTEPGQIVDFIKDHGGAGVQHIALGTDDIVRSVAYLADRGVDFLDTPDSYYELLSRRLTPEQHDFDRLRALRILVDEDHDGQLFQIFARSTHPRGTFFLEVIQRLRARSFGSGNIKALYAAMELERTRARR